MNQATTLLIDNIAFAKKNERLSGKLLLGQCPRLSEMLKDATGHQKNHIQYTLQGKTDVTERYFLHLTIVCQLVTQCQRCLDDMPLQFQLDFDYLIVDDVNDNEDAELDSDDTYDLQQASKAMDVVQLIEDEVLMAMPIAPTHQDNCGVLKTQSGEKPNPFAMLKGLVKDKNAP